MQHTFKGTKLRIYYDFYAIYVASNAFCRCKCNKINVLNKLMDDFTLLKSLSHAIIQYSSNEFIVFCTEINFLIGISRQINKKIKNFILFFG